MKKRLFLSLLSLFVSAIFAVAQPRTQTQEDSLDKQLATNTLLSAISEMKEIPDLQTRESLAESIVPLLAKTRPNSCREMLDAIFNDALKKKPERPSSDGAKKNTDKSGDADGVIRKLIKLAAKLDVSLAKKYIEEYTAEKEAQKKSKSSLSNELKMKLAIEMVNDDAAEAINLATQALSSGVTDDCLVFLATLRKKNIPLADNFALTAVQSIAAQRSLDDVNELFIIFAYVLTPQLIPAVRTEGLAFSSIIAYQEVADNYPINPTLSQQYFQNCARMMLRPDRYAALATNVQAARAQADFLFISLLEPYFPPSSPDINAQLLQRRGQISQYIQPQQITQLQTQINRWQELRSRLNSNSPKSNPRDSEFFANRAEQEKDPKLKDRFYYHTASTAVREKNFEKAQKLVDNISARNREKAQEYISFQIALQAIHDGNIEWAEKFLPQQNNRTRRAYLLTLMADVLANGNQRDTVRASELLTEVTIIASRSEEEKNQAAILFGCAQVYAAFDSVRAFETLRSAIDAANKVKDFNGDTGIADGIEFSGFYFAYPYYSYDLTFAAATDKLALINFSETVLSLNRLNATQARLQALVSACKSPLQKVEVSVLKN